MRTLYGPIDSWRFGRSLGVDPLAGKEKRCPFSCTYCQYGETLHPTWRRQPFVSVNRLEADLDLLGAVAADCVTFAGLGEPTLATNLPDLVAAVRRRFRRPVIVLTNSALIPDGNVRRDLLCFDAVVAKLDAPDAALFQQTNRPGSGFPYSLGAIVEGIRRFRRMYGGRLILQIMFVQASMHAVPRMARLARSLQPDEVQLCSRHWAARSPGQRCRRSRLRLPGCRCAACTPGMAFRSSRVSCNTRTPQGFWKER
jgi:wyosine [tRNA(Phe)-imidazoG37] synthetase (radical SAM superfamily)